MRANFGFGTLGYRRLSELLANAGRMPVPDVDAMESPQFGVAIHPLKGASATRNRGVVR